MPSKQGKKERNDVLSFSLSLSLSLSLHGLAEDKWDSPLKEKGENKKRGGKKKRERGRKRIHLRTRSSSTAKQRDGWMEGEKIIICHSIFAQTPPKEAVGYLYPTEF